MFTFIRRSLVRNVTPNTQLHFCSRRLLQTSGSTPQLASEPHPTDSFTVKLQPESFSSFKCNLPELTTQVSKAELLTMYREMMLIRRMEMAADALYKERLVRGFCHLSIGQEAVSVGLEHAITPSDRVLTAYRCHPFIPLRTGMSADRIKSVLGELLGRQSGISRGKGGSMHMFAPSAGFLGGHGIVGAHVPLAAGVALAQKYMGREREEVTLVLYGDGASNQGQVAEAFNMAKLWNLPIIFICENNKYGMGTSAERSSANPEYHTRGDTIPGIRINGMDILAVRYSVQHARRWIVEEGKGPIILEFVTYRYAGHSMSDPGTTYRSRDEVRSVRNTQDPIRGLQHRLEEWKVVTEEELKAIDKEAKTIVDAAVEEAKSSAEPPIEDLWTDVYDAGAGTPFRRGREREEIHTYH